MPSGRNDAQGPAYPHPVARKKDQSHDRTIENRRARFDYHISDTLEAGIMLRGSEVKSVRDGKVSLAEGYVRVQENPPGLYLHSITIDEYGPAGPRQHAMSRTRKLLAHRREIEKLVRQVQQKGMTIVPLRMYFKNGFAKVLIGLGKGKSRHDKRDAIAERESKRDISRAMSRRDRG
jgi:SsrA-binding protein